MEVHPRNSAERVFAICVLFMGVMINCTLVSSLSGAILSMHQAWDEQAKNLRKLRRFLRQRVCSPSMTMLVERQVTERMRQRERLTEADVDALQLVSSALRVELHYVVFEQQVRTHPLFRLWQNLDTPWAQRFCTAAVCLELYPPEDIIFLHGAHAEFSYYFAMGELAYTPMGDFYESRRTVRDSQWLCEVAMWCDFCHGGQAVAISHCELLAINVQAALRIIGDHPTIRHIARMYAIVFHDRAVCVLGARDLPSPNTDFGEIVFGMPMDVRRFIAGVALEEICVDATSSALAEEVDKGQSVIVQSGTGEVERVVALAVLQLERPDGRRLVRLGVFNADGEPEPSGKLPGGKMGEAEQPRDVIERIVDKEFVAIRSLLCLTDVSREVHWERSRQHNVRSKYVRIVQHAQLSELRNATLFQQVICADRSPRSPKDRLSRASGSVTFELQDCLILCDDQKVERFYAWLSQPDMEKLKAETVKTWLQQLRDCAAYDGIARIQLCDRHRDADAWLAWPSFPQWSSESSDASVTIAL